MAFIGGDNWIVEAYSYAVDTAMLKPERFAGTRVRIGGQSSDRQRRRALFRHDTSRALDSHLLTHCILFNAPSFGGIHLLSARGEIPASISTGSDIRSCRESTKL